MNFSRRAMMRNGMLVVSSGMAMPAIFSRGIASAQMMAAAGEKSSLAANDHVLIVVQMAGGNDGLNTIIPYNDGQYHKYRPTLALKGETVLPINDRLALHPNLAPLKPLWDQGHLALIEGVGYPNQSLSHFEAMDIWQTLDLEAASSEGWLGKLVSGWVDREGHPLRALNIGTETATALNSISTSVPSLTSIGSYRLAPDPLDKDNGDARTQALMKLYNSYPRTTPYAALLDTTAIDAQESVKQLQQADSQYRSTIQYPGNSFAAGLKILAETIVQNVGLRVGYVTLGGFDTHASQRSTHDSLMKTLADGLSAFYNDLVQHNKAENVIVVTWSEFGRRVQENGSQGTDHGTAAPMFILGNPIAKGIYGEPPDLVNLDANGNLKFSVDFRSVYATLLDRWMGANSKEILGNSFDSLRFLP